MKGLIFFPELQSVLMFSKLFPSSSIKRQFFKIIAVSIRQIIMVITLINSIPIASTSLHW